MTTEATHEIEPTTVLAIIIARDLAQALGWDHRPDVRVRAYEYEGEGYVITSGTGDGNYAYEADEVAAWLGHLGGKPTTYQDFCDAVDAIDPSPDLASAVIDDLRVRLCVPGLGVSAPTLAD